MVDLLEDPSFRDEFVSHDVIPQHIRDAYSITTAPYKRSPRIVTGVTGFPDNEDGFDSNEDTEQSGDINEDNTNADIFAFLHYTDVSIFSITYSYQPNLVTMGVNDDIVDGPLDLSSGETDIEYEGQLTGEYTTLPGYKGLMETQQIDSEGMSTVSGIPADFTTYSEGNYSCYRFLAL